MTRTSNHQDIHIVLLREYSKTTFTYNSKVKYTYGLADNYNEYWSLKYNYQAESITVCIPERS